MQLKAPLQMKAMDKKGTFDKKWEDANALNAIWSAWQIKLHLYPFMFRELVRDWGICFKGSLLLTSMISKSTLKPELRINRHNMKASQKGELFIHFIGAPPSETASEILNCGESLLSVIPIYYSPYFWRQWQGTNSTEDIWRLTWPFLPGGRCRRGRTAAWLTPPSLTGAWIWVWHLSVWASDWHTVSCLYCWWPRPSSALTETPGHGDNNI